MHTIKFDSSEEIPALGMGTWQMGEHPALRQEEIRSLQRGLDLGMRLIDSAEMYGEGEAEALVGEAIAGRRNDAFLVSKVYPHNATRKGAVTACERSLRRLGTDCIDLYLLHWRGSVPLAETVEAFLHLQRNGKIRHWGVSNLDTDDMQELYALPGGHRAATDQVLYNLTRRGIEWDLLPWCGARNIPLMAYSPIEQARLLDKPGLAALAREIGGTPAQLALAWLLTRKNVIAIPKASHASHVEENHGATNLLLGDETLARLDALFPPPRRATPLAML